MLLLVVPEVALQAIERAIVAAARSSGDLAGKPVGVGTIEPRMLRIAALGAVQIATGETCWPNSEELVIPRPKQVTHLVRVES